MDSEISKKTYQMGEILGEGGAGTVFLAQDDKGQTVVIKQFKNSILDIRSQGWKREMETLKHLNHPQIPKYLDYFDKVIEKRRLPHLVMEYKAGKNLEDILTKNHRLKMKESADILKQILRLLSYIHSFQPPLIHRDIKPSNLLLQEDGKLVLIDFGIAVDDVHKTVGRTMGVGTLGYQAPEQVSGDPTIQSDLYSVGVIAVQLFTKISPTTLLTSRGVLEWQRKCMDLPTKWYRWLERMLDVEPQNRFHSAEDAIKNMPEIDIEVEQKFIDRAKKMAHVPDVPTTGDFFAALKAESKEQRSEEIAEEERRREIERKKQETERKRQLEAELKRKEAQRKEEERRRREEEWKRNLEERKEAIATYKKKLEAEIQNSWDGLVRFVAAEELEVERGMNVFVEQFTPKMTFEYEGEKITVTSVEMELAKKYPKIPSKIVDAYVRKVEQRIVSRAEENTKVQLAKKELATLQKEIKNLSEQIQNLAFWQKWFGKDKELHEQKEEFVQKYQQIIERGKEACLISVTPYLFQDVWKERCSFTEVFEKEVGFIRSLIWPEEVYVSYVKEDTYSYAEGDFYVLKTQVTQRFWKSVTGQSPSHFKGDDLPVESVSWFDCILFANMLSEKLGLEKVYEIPKELTLGSSQDDDLVKKVKVNKSANGYRLPMEAEWEYAAKGGENYKYAGSNNLNEVGWYYGNSGSKTHPVGKKKANGYGLYDMSGNVSEWCFDEDTDDSNYCRGIRGGGCSTYASGCAVSSRIWNVPSLRINFPGVRLFRSVHLNS
jgi:formylglycine-generating enzyme